MIVSRSLRSNLSYFARSFSTDNAIASAAMVKKLREMSGAPLMDCKQALLNPTVQGDLQKAMDWLRAKGIAKATKGNRETKEGLIGVFQDERSLTLVEVNCETDFVAMNQDFQRFVATVGESIHHHYTGTDSKLPSAPLDLSVEEILRLQPIQNQSSTLFEPSTANPTNHPTLEGKLGDVISSIRENIVVKRAKVFPIPSPQQLIACYVHGKVSGIPSTIPIQLGRSVGVLSFAMEAKDLSTVSDFSEKVGRRLAMHLVASKPLFLSKQQVTSDFLEKEKAIFQEQMSDTEQKKPKEILEKILLGKVNKRLSEVCLLDQPHVAEEGNPVIAKFLQQYNSQHNCRVEIRDFDLWLLKP